MPLYQDKIWAEKDLLPQQAKWILQGVNPQVYKNPPDLCPLCGNQIKQYTSVSSFSGEIKCYPKVCQSCNLKAYIEYKSSEKAESYEAQKQRCAGLQNQKSFHVDHFPCLKTAKNQFSWQQDFFNYINAVIQNKTNSSLLVQGNTGSGKTYLAKILLNELVDCLMPVCFVKATDLAIFIKKLTYKDDYRQIMKDFKTVDTLIVDDFGIHRATDTTREILFSIFDSRYENRKRTIITTNLSNDALSKLEPRTASRMLDEKWMINLQFHAVDIRKPKEDSAEEVPF